MHVGVVAQRGNDRAIALAASLRRALRDEVDVHLGETAAAEVGTEATPIRAMTDFPLVVSIGGDGTFLFVARHVGSTPILGVNLGEVGFLVTVPPAAAVEAVRAELDAIEETGEPRTRPLPRLEAHGEGVSVPAALNEVLVHGPRRGRGGGLDFEVHAAGSRYAAVHADGVIVATATGSTAYNLSEGGPIVHPAAADTVVTVMAPTEPVPPIVVDRGTSIRVEARGGDRVLVASDGSARAWIDAPATISVEESGTPVRVAGPRPDFYRSLRKLDDASHLGPP